MKKKIGLISGIAGAAILSAVTLASCGGSSSVTTINGKPVEITTRNIYITPTGNQDADGTDKNNPTTFTAAIQRVKPGDNFLLAGGSYCYDYRVGIPLDNDGEEYNYITVQPETENDRVIFDFSSQTFDGSNRGIQIYADYWHFKNIEVTGAGDNGMYIAGSHNIIENCLFYNNRDTGLQLGRGYSNQTTIDQWPAYNLIKNCTSFANYDAETYGENADGFAAKLTIGYGNVFDGCMAFRNSDDGWDLFAKSDSGDIGTVVLYNCISFENGYLPYQIAKESGETNPDGTPVMTYNTLNGDGIGFKLGGSTMEGNVLVNNCAAWDNKLHGVGDNSNPGVLSVKNFTAFNNCSGLNADGTVRSIRGIDTDQNKSNNIDLARTINSYNNYYGILSYVNNQTGFSTANDSSYNKDAFKGSAAYSVFQTTYKNGEGELYNYFTGYEDASSYATESVDTQFSSGVQTAKYVSDADFKNLSSTNAVIANAKATGNDQLLRTNIDFNSLIALSKTLRNSDGSINTGDHLALADNSKFKTFANGQAIGATLNKTSYDAYTHYGMKDWTKNNLSYTDDEIAVIDAASVCEVIADNNAIYQDFKLPKYIQGCDITWVSKNKDVVKIDTDETYTVSNAVFSYGRVSVPEKETKVKLVAAITINSTTINKEVEVTVKGRKQILGELTSSNTNAIRVDLYGHYAAPQIFAHDGSSITGSELPATSYTLSYSYRYATDGNSKFYTVDNVYTSIAGVYEVTATAKWNANEEITSSITFFVYVVDPDCEIDFLGATAEEKSTVTLSNSGFVVTGNLSGIDGDVIAITSPTELTLNSAADLIAKGNYQSYPIVTNYVAAKFKADNSSEVSGNVQYYIYYSVVNKNKSNAATASVYKATVNVVNVSTEADFAKLARTGKVGTSSSSTTIYSLTKDLDFAGYTWDLTTYAAFQGLFKGNNHTIKNITINGGAKDTKNVNVFYKLEGGTVMDVNFEEVKITADTTVGKQVAIIGELQGGFVYNVHAKKVAATGKESIGGIIGQITGGENLVELCSLVNPTVEGKTLEEMNTNNQYKITAKNKYAGGIVGNGQMNSDQSIFTLTIKNCYVNATIGDGNDAGGNTGLIIGRIKNDSAIYKIELATNVVYGTVIAHGQYNAGIIGDFDNGVGYVSIHGNLSMVQFVYNGVYLNAMDIQMNPTEEITSYAHKNSNPIVGRAVHAEEGIYETSANLGSFTEYYSTYIVSTSFYFSICNYEEEGSFKALSLLNITSYTEIDPTKEESVWTIASGDGEDSDIVLILKCLKK